MRAKWMAEKRTKFGSCCRFVITVCEQILRTYAGSPISHNGWGCQHDQLIQPVEQQINQ